MVLESLISPIKAEKKPWEMFFIGILYSSIAIIISIFLFRDYASLIAIFFTVMASIPIIYWTIKMEEKKDLSIHEEKVLIKEHGKALAFFVFLFLGFVVSFSLWYVLLPADISSKVFEIQTNTISQINNPLTGNAYNLAGTFTKILFNNIKVLLFCLIFAFFYGFGAIFILTWNASIIGVAIGDFMKSHIGNYAAIMSIALLKYLIHGIPEILAYFMAGLAGGIISIAVIRHDLKSNKFKHILLDSADLTFGAVVMLVIAALLEVFVSPLII
ncbi:MAG: stage II sporulation protein M [Nanoarchaeota archaeon]|nr:stage II sporulation protein M [Nanoarchaeota archaeon]